MHKDKEIGKIMNGNISIDSVFAACNDAEQALNKREKQNAENDFRFMAFQILFHR